MRAGQGGEDGYRGRLPDSTSTSINCGQRAALILYGEIRQRPTSRADRAAEP